MEIILYKDLDKASLCLECIVQELLVNYLILKYLRLIYVCLVFDIIFNCSFYFLQYLVVNYKPVDYITKYKINSHSYIAAQLLSQLLKDYLAIQLNCFTTCLIASYIVSVGCSDVSNPGQGHNYKQPQVLSAYPKHGVI